MLFDDGVASFNAMTARDDAASSGPGNPLGGPRLGDEHSDGAHLDDTHLDDTHLESVSAHLESPASSDVLGLRANELVASLEQTVDGLAGMDMQSLNARVKGDLSQRLDTAWRRLKAIRYDLVVIDEAEVPQESGARTPTQLEVKTSNGGFIQARKTVERAQALREDFPLFRQALRESLISEEHVDIVRRYINTPELKQKLSDPTHGEGRLLAWARSMSTHQFAKQVKAWVYRWAPRQANEETLQQTVEEKLHIFQKQDHYVINGRLSLLNGTVVYNLIQAITRTNLRNSQNAGSGQNPASEQSGHGVRPDDSSTQLQHDLQPSQQQASLHSAANSESPKVTAAQLQANALVELCARVLEEGVYEGSARTSPHVSVHCPVETLAVAQSRYEEAQLHEEGARLHGEAGMIGAPATESSAHDIPPNIHPNIHPDLGRKLGQIKPGISAEFFTGLEPARLDDGTPLSPAQLQTIIADSQISRVVFGQGSEVLDLGRQARLASPAQARAIRARDKHCQYPGCSHPFPACRIHHAHYWERGGPTDLNNMVLVCWYHHALIHQLDLTATHYEHGWVFTTPEGKTIT
ncbi:HNH endonuclease signature motif containing protein [Trueperella bialowiezensis]|uniref:DUF222 domain-containing protein n=1 Tax=Trueperella bialowiezensis TaxID=312285 RepID=A0A448PEG3_9ACTO|nr:HNH endonuclease signature motif containing protein [Trueperella bialowiezensis]VEI13331.1 Uncharacterised protein [Trueperella bialowiezensis]